MAWQYNKKVLATFAFHGAQTSWANLDGGTGWKRIKSGQPDGVTNLTVLINSAHTERAHRACRHRHRRADHHRVHDLNGAHRCHRNPKSPSRS